MFIDGLEAKANDPARPSLYLAACRPCFGLCGFGGGFEGAEVAVNTTAYACNTGTSPRHGCIDTTTQITEGSAIMIKARDSITG